MAEAAVRRRGAWVLVLVVVGAWLLAGLAAAAGLAPRAGSSSTAPDSLGVPGDGPVVVVGVPGLTWDLLASGEAPRMEALAEEGGAGALVLRGTHEVTCAADAWLTLGAGQRAASDLEGCEGAGSGADPGPGAAGPTAVSAQDVVVPEGDGAVVDPDAWGRWTRAGAQSSLRPELGTLAAAARDGGTCVAAYDPLAALGAADARGRVTAYLAAGAEDRTTLPADLQPGCAVHLMSTVPAGEGTIAGVDEQVGALADRLPDGATLVVAGLGHTRGRAEATALLVHPVPGGGSTLTSGSTGQRSLVQLTDLTPTVLVQAGAPGEPLPAALAGRTVTASPSDDGAVRAADLAAAVSGAKAFVPWALGSVAVVVLPVLLVGLLRRSGRLVAVGGTAGTAVPVATWLAGLLPWWRAGQPAVTLATAVLVGVALVVGLAWAGPWRREPLGPAAVVAALTLVVVGVDVLWSARLGLVSVLGLQPVTAGRFYGQGNVGFGVVLGAFVVLAGTVLTWMRQGRSRGGRRGAGRVVHGAPREGDGGRLGGAGAAVAVLLLGAGLTVVNAAPWGGADFGGVPAMVVATGLLALAALGLRWSVGRLAGLAVGGVGVAAAVMVLDWLRGPERRTHLGAFVQQVLDGEALGIVTRKLDQSLGILVDYPLSWLAVVALALFAVVVVRRPAWSAPLWRQEGLRPAALAGLVAMVLGWVLNDSGIAVVALALTVLVGAALAVLGRAGTHGTTA